MIRKSGCRFSDKIMLKQQVMEYSRRPRLKGEGAPPMEILR
jgi:hypothetical protein